MREFKRIITHSLVQNIKEIAKIKIEHSSWIEHLPYLKPLLEHRKLEMNFDA
jgi:hypothetical protein